MIVATASNAIPMNTNIKAGTDFEIAGTTLVKYRGNEKRVVIPDGIERLGERAFERSQIEEVVIPDSVKSTEKMVFASCPNLKRVEIGSGLSSIYSCIFTDCISLEEFIVSPENKDFRSEDGVLIGYFSYYPSAKAGKYYKIPDGNIKRFYFENNPYIESIYISDNIELISLEGTSNLRTLEVSENNKNFRVVDGVLYDYNMEVLICYPSAKAGQDYIIPVTLKRFGTFGGELWTVKELKNIYFPGSCPREYPGRMDAGSWYDWVKAFGGGDKIYDIYYYDDASWEELREGYNSNFGYTRPRFEMRFHSFERGSCRIVPDSDYIWLGESVKLKVVEPDLEHGILKEKKPGFWRVGDGRNKISDNGVFTGLVEGTAKVTAGGNELLFDIEEEISVKKKLVQSIVLLRESIIRAIGVKEKADLKILPDDAFDKSVKWYSTAPDVVTVDEQGNIETLSAGWADIYCISQDGGNVESNKWRVYVNGYNEPVKSVLISPANITLKIIGEERKLSASVDPSNLANKSVIWHSTNTRVATVNEMGIVKAVAAGTAEIYCISQNGNKESNHCIVKVISDNSGGGSSSGGGGSSSGGGGGSSKGHAGGPSIGQSNALPDYVIKGNWNHSGDGTWSFTDTAGNRCVNQWAAVKNPYADTAKGQQGFDWFRFDELGKMVTGWYYDSAEGFWYYLNPVSDNTLGRMVTGWFMVDGYYYYFNPNSDGHRGRMYVNETTPDGYRVDGNGRWVNFSLNHIVKETEFVFYF